MTDHAFDRAELAEAVGNDIADMAHFWMLRKFQFLEPAREQFEIIVDPWLSYSSAPIAMAKRCSSYMLTSRRHRFRLPRSSGSSGYATRSISRALAFWTRILRPAWSC